MAITYQKAPISELIFGVIFNNNLLANDYILFELISELKKEYPILHTQPPIFEEELQGYNVFQNINIASSGFSLYRLSSSDKRYLIQLQQNFIILNWVRNDDQKVGLYPGFSEVYERFKKIFSIVESKFSSFNTEIDLYRNIKAFTLHYQDRVFYKAHIPDLSAIEEIINIKIPSIKSLDDSINPANNIFSKYTIPMNNLNGYSIVSINTGLSKPTNEQVLIVECRLKGKYDGNKLDDWFKSAHEIQVKFFENFFTTKILDSWKA